MLDAGAFVAVVGNNKYHLDSLTKYYPQQGFSFAYELNDPDELNLCFKKVNIFY